MSKAAAAKTKEEPQRVHPLVVAFVVFHVLAITIYALPKPSQKVLDGTISPKGSDTILKFNQENLKQTAFFYGYLYTLGTWQYWDMFAPDPSNTDMWVDAEITYFDGTKSKFDYPRMYSLSLPQKFIRERHRKYYERVNDPVNRYSWPPFAQYMALQSATDPKNPPVRVALTRHFQLVMDHRKPKPQEPPYVNVTYYTYVVDKAKLFSDKGWKLGQP